MIESLLEKQQQAGAVPDSEQQLAHFGNWRDEYRLAHEKAAVFDLSARDELTLTGRDRAQFLHGFCSNDIKKLTPGTGCEAFVTSIKGRTLGHIFVYATEDALILDTTAGTFEELFAHLDRYLITEDVSIQKTSDQRHLFHLMGPQAVEFVSKLTAEAADLLPMQFCEVVWKESTLQIRRVDWVSQPGFQISVFTKQGPEFWDTMMEQGIQPAGQRCWEAIRVQMRFPQFAVDFTDNNLAQEVDRTSQAISFTKGCYLGQEPIARIDALGHVNQLLRRISFSASGVDAAEFVGASVYRSADDIEAAKPIATISSATECPGLAGEDEQIHALCLIRREFAEPGAEVTVFNGTGFLPATVF